MTDDTTTPEAPAEVPGFMPEILAVPGLANPAELREAMVARVRQFVTDARTERGPVTRPEDTHKLIRRLAGGADSLKHYARIVTDVTKEAVGHIEDELVEAVGEDKTARPAARWNGDGIPAQNMKVPDIAIDGDWTLTREWDSEVEVEWHALISVEAGQVAEAAIRGEIDGIPSTVDDGEQDRPAWDEVEDVYRTLAQEVAEKTLDRMLFLMSPPKPKTTALEAWAKLLGRSGDDRAASIVASNWRRRRTYKGLKVERT